MGIFRRRSKDLFTIPEQGSAPAAPPMAPGEFRLVVEDCFFITGRGVVITGRIASGSVSVGDRVTLERGGQGVRTLEISGIEQFRKTVTTASAGEAVGLLFRKTAKGEIVPGDVIRG